MNPEWITEQDLREGDFGMTEMAPSRYIPPKFRVKIAPNDALRFPSLPQERYFARWHPEQEKDFVDTQRSGKGVEIEIRCKRFGFRVDEPWLAGIVRRLR